MLISPDRLFDGSQFHENVTLKISQGRIHEIVSKRMADAVQLDGTLTAGFIDCQVNGGGGKLFNTEPTVTTLEVMMQAHAQFGTTSLLPTLITDSIQTMQLAADAVADALHHGLPGILGLHFEGPHLSEPKKGVHPAPHIRDLTDNERQLYRRNDVGIRLVTLAPERVEDAAIRELLHSGVKVSIGHSNACYERTGEVLALGVDGFTHLFNAMSPFTSREPGVVGAALLSEQAHCSLILDGHHTHFAAAKLAHRMKAKGKLFLVTDAMSTIGCEQKEFDLFGVVVTRDKDKLTTPDGTLAGSALDMMTAVKNAVTELALDLGEALNMASLYPAQYLGIDATYGSISPGKRADLVLIDTDFKVKKTWIGGDLVFDAELG